MRLWKRRAINRVFGADKALIFRNGKAALPHAKKTGRSLLVWAQHERELGDTDGVRLRRVEDGFLRSRGLGADLVTPLSLVVDDLGIYYDATRESRLERHIAAATDLPDVARKRAERLVAGLIKARLSKYNLPGTIPKLPEGRRILVPGQVEDDASILLGCTGVRTNFGLLEAARIANPGAVIVYKPHPDVETGLRPGRIDPAVAREHADVIADHADPIALIEACDEVWTLTSLMGFEALIRGKPVTCLGAPFYAGWGLTTDLGWVPDRRQARPDVIALAHAALIDYPRYYDPVTRSICPVEVAVDRLADGIGIRDGLGLRLLAKAQGALSSYAHLWR
jgi:capsular polysaccharide export protein